MTLTPEALYLQLGQLIAEMPDLANGPITADVNRWWGRAAALLGATNDIHGEITVRNAAQYLGSANRELNAQIIAACVHQAFAKAELAAPAAVQGAFILAGHRFDVFAAVGKVLSTAKSDVLMIDPYADAKVLTDYALLAPEQVSVRVLADQAFPQPSLEPAARHWASQFGPTRPLSVRMAAARTLHDRALLVDHTTAWTLGQTFKDLVARAHTALTRLEAEPGALKIAAYEQMWAAATPLWLGGAGPGWRGRFGRLSCFPAPRAECLIRLCFSAARAPRTSRPFILPSLGWRSASRRSCAALRQTAI